MDESRWHMIKSSDPSWFCFFLKKNSIFDADNIESMWREMVQEIESLQSENKRLRMFAEDIWRNWDCDEDAHKYGTPCRCCEAKKLLQGLAEIAGRERE